MILTTAESVSELGLSEAQAADFAGSAGSVAVAYGGAAARVFAVGVGPAAGVTSESLRSGVRVRRADSKLHASDESGSGGSGIFGRDARMRESCFA